MSPARGLPLAALQRWIAAAEGLNDLCWDSKAVGSAPRTLDVVWGALGGLGGLTLHSSQLAVQSCAEPLPPAHAHCRWQRRPPHFGMHCFQCDHLPCYAEGQQEEDAFGCHGVGRTGSTSRGCLWEGGGSDGCTSLPQCGSRWGRG